ncbi:MAG: AbrB/MazE/SpoVT family DNA-binding domain-containing protein [Promethearchaeia archaeon]
MIIKRKVGSRGQIVIPKDIRDYFKINAGSEIIFEVRQDEIILRPAKKDKEFLDEFLKTPKKLKKPVSFKQILDKQYKRG